LIATLGCWGWGDRHSLPLQVQRVTETLAIADYGKSEAMTSKELVDRVFSDQKIVNFIAEKNTLYFCYIFVAVAILFPRGSLD
jgi:hypothetical protein